MTIKLSYLNDIYNKCYEYIYNNGIAYYDELVTLGDMYISQSKDLTSAFVKYRGDFLSSDREVASYGLALYILSKD